MQRIDLHTHTTASDGTDTPGELVRKAVAADLAAIAVTDHDTVSGLREAEDAGHGLGITIIRGCEISSGTEYGEVHILGLWLPRDIFSLERCLAYLRSKREQRNETILAKLRRLGIMISMDELRAKAAGEAVGRPHIAALLAEKEYVPDVKTAFSEYLGRHGKAYAPRKLLAPKTVVGLLSALGATVILAHPLLHHYPQRWLADLLKELAEFGLCGIEAWHSDHSVRDTQICLDWAAQLCLAPSGGSDYHGMVKPEIGLGTGYGNLCIPLEILENIKKQRKAQGLWI